MSILTSAIITIISIINLCYAEGLLTVFQHCPPNSVWYSFVEPKPSTPTYQPLTSDLNVHFGDYPEGTSLKIGRSQNPQSITQFEFGWDRNSKKIWYDLSSLDGTPFRNDGVEVYPSHGPSNQFPMCQTLDCPAGYDSCRDVFLNPADEKSMSCPDDTSFVVGLCIGSGFGYPQPPASRRRSE